MCTTTGFLKGHELFAIVMGITVGVLLFALMYLPTVSTNAERYIEEGREKARQEFYNRIGYEEEMNKLRQAEVK